jgi:hypothetical protein
MGFVAYYVIITIKNKPAPASPMDPIVWLMHILRKFFFPQYLIHF